jgi:PKHD-type hydroxylase
MYLFENPNQQLTWDYIIEDVLSSSQIESIKNYVSSQSLEDGKIGEIEHRSNTDLRRSKILFLNDYDTNNELYQHLISNMLSANNEHFRYNITYAEPFQYSEYYDSDQGCYNIHTDTNLRNPHGYTRKLTFSILLNDTSEFKGGQLCYHLSQSPTIVNQKQGDMIFFPSFVPHSVTPVTQGIRKSLVGWICGPNFI